MYVTFEHTHADQNDGPNLSLHENGKYACPPCVF